MQVSHPIFKAEWFFHHISLPSIQFSDLHIQSKRREGCELTIRGCEDEEEEMGKGEETIAKKRNKVKRKRLRRDLATTSDFIKGVIAAKHRRKAGKRRMCEGMCYTLPTPENPFNDPIDSNSGKKCHKKKKQEPSARVKEQLPAGKKDTIPQKRSFFGDEIDNTSWKKQKKEETVMENIEASLLHKTVSLVKDLKQNEDELSSQVVSSLGLSRSTVDISRFQRSATPEMILKLTLDVVSQTGEADVMQEGEYELTSNNKWGRELWEACLKGSNILASSQVSFDLQQTAVLVSAAASHIIDRRRRDSFVHGPMVLIVVASQEQAVKVRMIGKPLKSLLEIRSVSLHPGASLAHQVKGLGLCVPEILVSTPERLSNLIALKALDISSISFLVIDGLKKIVDGDFVDDLKSLRQHILGNPQTVVLSNTYAGMCTTLAQYLLKDPIQRVSEDKSIALQSACITQSVSIFISEEKKVEKILKILRAVRDKQQSTLLGSIAIIVGSVGKERELLATLESEGYSVNSTINDPKNQGKIPGNGSKNDRLHILVTTESQLDGNTLSEVQIVIIYDFPSALQTYIKLLTGMARSSTNGILYSFCSGSDAPLAAQLIKLLEQCSQPVPQALQMLADADSIIQQ